MTATKTPKKTPPDALTRQLIALQAFAKSVPNGARDQLEAGREYSVDCEIAGKIDGRPVSVELVGQLKVGHNSERTSSSAPKLVELVTYLLQRMPATTRNAIYRNLATQYENAGRSFPKLASELIPKTETLLDQLKKKTQETKRGDVSFAQREAE